jgi:hypothetical protein
LKAKNPAFARFLRLVPFRRDPNQENYYESHTAPPRMEVSTLWPNREMFMSGQVVLYFEDQADALRFALAAGSVMAGEGGKFTSELVEETARVTRIRLDAVNGGNSRKPNPGCAA